jgi:hypothetical protein
MKLLLLILVFLALLAAVSIPVIVDNRKPEIPYINGQSIQITDEAMIYRLDTSDTVWFKPCEGKRTFLGFYDKATNSIRLK